jgi:hypothetical protein
LADRLRVGSASLRSLICGSGRESRREAKVHIVAYSVRRFEPISKVFNVVEVDGKPPKQLLFFSCGESDRGQD